MALAALLLAAASPVAAGPADTQSALNACAGNYPDSARIKASLKKAGFADKGVAAGVHVFLSADGKTFVGTQGDAAISQRCILLEDRLSNARATAMAQAVLKLMPGAAPQKPAAAAISGAWRGMLNNQVANLYVIRNQTLGALTGALLILDLR
jgi:hypothetical protein